MRVGTVLRWSAGSIARSGFGSKAAKWRFTCALRSGEDTSGLK
jgi:hypothetical protein